MEKDRKIKIFKKNIKLHYKNHAEFFVPIAMLIKIIIHAANKKTQKIFNNYRRKINFSKKNWNGNKCSTFHTPRLTNFECDYLMTKI